MEIRLNNKVGTYIRKMNFKTDYQVRFAKPNA